LVNCITKGGSPLEKVATIWASSTGAPQSSANRTISVSGQPTGASKLLTSPVWVKESREGTHPDAALRFALSTLLVALAATAMFGADPVKPTAPGTPGDPVWQRIVRLSDGRTLVTDGSFAIDAALAKPAKLPTTEASGKVIEGFLARQGPEVPITDLRSAGATYKAPNGMKLNATYVDYLRRILGERAGFRIGGELEPIVIVANGKPVGVLMAVRR